MYIRIAEILPGTTDDTISCLLHEVEWAKLPDYEALSYAWGDPNDKDSILVHDEELKVNRSLCVALQHLRYENQSRFIWADAIWSVCPQFHVQPTLSAHSYHLQF